MAEDSSIEWTDHTFNPWIGCTKVSPGCANCYAEAQDRFRSWTPEGWGKGKPRKRTSAANWKKPLRWNEKAKKEGVRYRIFCASLADWLDDEVPVVWLCELLELIRLTPHLDWLLLTKRPENWAKRHGELGDFLDGDTSSLTQWLEGWYMGYDTPENVWIGTSVENQEQADHRITLLNSIPASVRFLSCEPLLEPVDLEYPESVFPDGPEWCCSGRECGCHGMPAEPPLICGIDWVIVGGESGPNAREFEANWARHILDVCKKGQAKFFMKQMGGKRKPFVSIPEDLMVREFPKGKEVS